MSTQAELLSGIEQNAKETDSSNSFKREPIEGTPFTKIYDGEKHFAVMGLEMITDKFDTEEEVDKALEGINWKVLLNVIAAAVKLYNDLLSINNTTNE